MFLNPNQNSPFSQLSPNGFGGPSFGQQNPMMGMFMQLMQMMMTLMMGQMSQMTGGQPGMGAMSALQNPGFGGVPGGAGFPGGFNGAPGGYSPATGMNNFLGAPGGTPGRPGNFGGGGPSGLTNTPNASVPFAGVNSNQDWAAKLPPALRNLAPHFQAAGQRFNVDPKFLAAISMLETGKGTSNAFRNKNNAMGVSNSRGPISFSNPADSIYKMAETLSRRNGPYRGASTIAQIGRIYAPPGAGNDPNGTNGYWPRGVSKYYQQLGGNPQVAVKG